MSDKVRLQPALVLAVKGLIDDLVYTYSIDISEAQVTLTALLGDTLIRNRIVSSPETAALTDDVREVAR